MSSAFSWFVILGTLGSLAGYFLLLYLNRTTKNPGRTTGHVYDGIEEYDNPLPAWWFWGFIISILFALGYLLYYPGLGNFTGFGAWSQVGELTDDQDAADERYGPIFAQYAAVPVDDLVNDPAAMRMGRRLFATNCSVCHGTAGTGREGEYEHQRPERQFDHPCHGGNVSSNSGSVQHRILPYPVEGYILIHRM